MDTSLSESRSAASQQCPWYLFDSAAGLVENPPPPFLLAIDVGRDGKMLMRSKRLGADRKRGTRQVAESFCWKERRSRRSLRMFIIAIRPVSVVRWMR